MSKRIELTPRLRMVADLLPAGKTLVDVGTDHAYLPAAMIQEGKISSAIAADLREGPLSRAKETVRACGLHSQVTFRLCNGLMGIKPEEAGAVAIAGMGGETIGEILNAAPWVQKKGISLVLQPMSSMEDLRVWLAGNGYMILKEDLAREGDTIYTALLVTAGEMETLTPAEQLAGKNSNHPLRGAWLDHWLNKMDHALAGLSKARQEGLEERRVRMKEIRDGLMQMKEEWERWQQ